jgi:hypothetical protein
MNKYMMKNKLPMIILYVADQVISKNFYESILYQPPILDVPGMTEFNISPYLKLGLMPEKGIAKIICPSMPHPSNGKGIPRCELYLMVEDPELQLDTAIKAGAKLIDPVLPRDWGDMVGYCSDPDGHIIAFAK